MLEKCVCVKRGASDAIQGLEEREFSKTFQVIRTPTDGCVVLAVNVQIHCGGNLALRKKAIK